MPCSSPVSSLLSTPPLSLTHSSPTGRYSREDLLTLAQSAPSLPPAPARLETFTPILRRASQEGTEGAINESMAGMLDGKPISPVFPTPALPFLRTNSLDASCGRDGGLILRYGSTEVIKPVMIDFVDPFANSSKALGARRASTAFQSFPSSVNSSSASIPGAMAASSLGEKYLALRASSSITSSSARSRSSSMSSNISNGGLNPFAPPFPLPNLCTSAEQHEEVPSLPLPKTLPSSLPRRPPGPIAPVFVKRESAALPQPMSLPDIAPLGKEWEGENSLSGNDRRRRASELGLPALPIRLDGTSAPGKSATSTSNLEQQPERLVKLGEKLRQSIASKGIAVKSQVNDQK